MAVTFLPLPPLTGALLAEADAPDELSRNVYRHRFKPQPPGGSFFPIWQASNAVRDRRKTKASEQDAHPFERSNENKKEA